MTDDRTRQPSAAEAMQPEGKQRREDAADRFIDPNWPEPAQRIIADKHARSARQPIDEPDPETGSEGGAPDEDGPGQHASPDNLNVEHENQARWREIKM